MYMRFSGRVPIIPAECDRNANRRAGEAVTRVRRLRHLLCGSRRGEGQTIVEFALVFMLFMFLVFGVFDFGHLFFVKMTVQNAVQEAARFASTGNHLPDPEQSGQDLSRVDSIIATLQQHALGADITNIQISSLNGGTGSAGGPGDMMTITVTASTPLLTPLIARLFPQGRYAFTTSVTIKNEPFLACNTK
jgi:Flp pilus assembly protein TadG